MAEETHPYEPELSDEVAARRRGLQTGWTTGTCASAAAKAAAIGLTTGTVPIEVEIGLPNGSRVSFAVEGSGAVAPGGPAAAVVVKDAGDDPDCTDGARMTASVEWLEDDATREIHELVAGEGIGTITKPGLGLPVGAPAINPVPRRMIGAALAEVPGLAGSPGGGRRLRVVFSVPDGEAMAAETSNERLGILGGISILGTSGIVRPFSTAAYRASVVQQVDVAAAQGEQVMVLCTGARSEQAAMASFPSLDRVCFVEVGDFTGIALRRCVAAGMHSAAIVAMVGKITKLAAGIMMTHWHRTAVDTELLARVASETGAPPEAVSAATETATARHFFEVCVARGSLAPLERLCALAAANCRAHVDDKLAIEVLMVDFEGQSVVARVPEVDARLVSVIGIADDRLELLAPEAKEALRTARTVLGGRRHLALYRAWREAEGPAADTLPITADTEELMARVRALVSGGEGPLCVLASGDPGFFGILRALLNHLDRHQLRVLPAPSSVSVAFARLGLPWDDAVIVSAHGRPLDDAVRVARTAPKVAVLTSPDSPPEALGKALLAAGCAVDAVAVCSRLGSPEEHVRELSLDELAEGRFEPLSVVVVIGPGTLPLTGWSASGAVQRARSDRVLAWGRDDAVYAHRGGMITKAETRSIALGKLSLLERGVLWDVGAGSGSIAIEAALLCPGLTVFAIDESEEAAERISANAAAAGVGVHVIAGSAPGSLANLPDPDRAFVGGGGTAVLEAVLGRLAPGGHVVATFAALDRAVDAAHLLGHLIQIRADRGEQLPDGSWRLAANNPVFLAWGPAEAPT